MNASKRHSELVETIETALTRLHAQDRFEIQYVEDARVALASLEEQYAALQALEGERDSWYAGLRREHELEVRGLKEQLETQERALRDLLDWTTRMPDALLGPEDPRWEWWNEGVWPRQAARNLLRDSSDQPFTGDPNHQVAPFPAKERP